MAKEFFRHTVSGQLFETIESISRRSNVSRVQSFEDVLRASVAALAAETMEPEYFDAIKAHTKGDKGKRGVDLFPVFLGQVVNAISDTDADVLGDVFQGAISSYGENGLYLTPPAAELMARLTVRDDTEEKESQSIFDPCCGSGILLLEAGKKHPQAELIGQDVDPRCAQIAAINLGLCERFGWVICGSTLTREVNFVYRIGSFFREGPNGLRRGVIRSIPPEQCPVLPEIQSRTRGELDAAQQEPPPDASQDQQVPSIIEIPDWALRRHLAVAL